jgi:hypothetical protein
MVPLVLRLSKPYDITIHWKALKEHVLMVPLGLGLTLPSKHNDMTVYWKTKGALLMVPLVLRLSKRYEITILWKALNEHLMVPLFPSNV